MSDFVIAAVGKEPRVVSQAAMQKEYGHLLSPVIMNLGIVDEAVVIKDGFTITIRKVTGDVTKNY